MLDQIKALLKEAAAQKYVPTLGPKASDPVETKINKTRRANVKPQEKKPLTKISEFMSSDPFADAFLDETDKIAKRRISGTAAAILGAGAGLLGPVVGPPMAKTTWRAGEGAVRGVMAGPRGVEAKKMPTLPGQADADAENAARLAAKAKETIAKMHPSSTPAPVPAKEAFPGTNIFGKRKP